MLMKCIIVDDDRSSRKLLVNLCQQFEDLQVVVECDNARDALNYIQEHPVDFMFLDIQMPHVSGIDIVKETPNLPQIVFTTGHKEYALESYEYDVTDYLLKPITKERLEKAIEKIQQKSKILHDKQEKSTTELFVKVGTQLIKLEYEDILWVEAQGDYVQIQLRDKKHLVYNRLKTFEQKLPVNKFLKVHRSFIVNMKEVENIQENSLIINGQQIPISRSKKPLLRTRINKF